MARSVLERNAARVASCTVQHEIKRTLRHEQIFFFFFKSVGSAHTRAHTHSSAGTALYLLKALGGDSALSSTEMERSKYATQNIQATTQRLLSAIIPKRWLNESLRRHRLRRSGSWRGVCATKKKKTECPTGGAGGLDGGVF
jgi:hypothetical protein